MKKLTREEWLNQIKKEISLAFKKIGYEIPSNIRISCGLPSNKAFGQNAKTIGQCWDKAVSSDNTFEIFISPTVSDSIVVAATLVHEIVHATVGVKEGHKGKFKELAQNIGLIGKMTATEAGQELKAFLQSKIQKLGEYPHASIDYTKRKVQKTRLIKMVCVNNECNYLTNEGKNYSVRMSQTAINYGIPFCGCCGLSLREG